MEMTKTAIYALQEQGRELAVKIEEDIWALEGTALPWTEFLLRRRLTSAQLTVHHYTKRCLDYELAASDLIQRTCRYADPANASRMPFADIDTYAIYAQRDTLRTLLGALKASVADIKESCETSVTNIINFLILFLTVSSIAVAVVSYRVAKVTYDDAVTSGKKQEASMDKEIVALEKSSETLEKVSKNSAQQEGLLSDITNSARAQTNYLAEQQAAERERNEMEVQHNELQRFRTSAEDLRAFYQELDADVRQEIQFESIQQATSHMPHLVVDGERASISARVQLAELVAEWSQLLGSEPESINSRPSAAWQLRLHNLRGIASKEKYADLPENLYKAYDTLIDRIADLTLREKGMPLIRDTLGALSVFFSTEAKLYSDINQSYLTTGSMLAQESVWTNHVDASGIFAPVRSQFGLAAQVPAGGQDAALSQIRQSYQEQMSAFQLRISSVSVSLEDLESSLNLQLARHTK